MNLIEQAKTTRELLFAARAESLYDCLRTFHQGLLQVCDMLAMFDERAASEVRDLTNRQWERWEFTFRQDMPSGPVDGSCEVDATDGRRIA